MSIGIYIAGQEIHEAYGTRGFTAVFTEVHHYNLFLAKSVHITSHNPIIQDTF
jgi:hypothetical protein